MNIRKVWNLEEWDNNFKDRGRWEVGDGKKLGSGRINGWTMLLYCINSLDFFRYP